MEPKRKVLAIALDAAEASLVRDLSRRGQMPHLRSLWASGTWAEVESPADLGSGAVWPTFQTGASPVEHGCYAEWSWDPRSMSLGRTQWGNWEPFWKALARRGYSVGVLDVPFAPVLGLPNGFEIADWGAHDWLGEPVRVSPKPLGGFVGAVVARHPFTSVTVDAAGPRDVTGQRRVGELSLIGARRRGELIARLIVEQQPDLLLAVFPELHRAGHFLWQTVEPEHPLHADLPPDAFQVRPSLADVYREVDRQIGRLVALAGPETTIIVFALHGMQASRGVPAWLGSWLELIGVTRQRSWSARTWGDWLDRGLATGKRLAPAILKHLYYRRVPRSVVLRLAQPSLPAPNFEWSRTRAFCLPTDQNGWIRLNVAGREAAGIVRPEAYAAVCARLAAKLRSVVGSGGRPMLESVRVLDPAEGHRPGWPLPDLVVHWSDASFEGEFWVGGRRFTAPPIGLKFTGQHSFKGFCIYRPARGQAVPPVERVRVAELHQLLEASLAAP